jgi:hypothetical protein
MNGKQNHSSNHGQRNAGDGSESRPDVIQKFRKTTPDFSIRDEGSIVLLTPLSPSAHEFVEERIGSNNGFQPYWPTVVIERRHAQDILEGVIAEGMVIA